MFFVTFAPQAGGHARTGLMTADRSAVIDLAAGQAELGGATAMQLPTDMVALIAAGDAAITAARQLLEQQGAGKLRSSVHSVEQIQLLAPIPRPRKNVFAVGLNYADHVDEWQDQPDLPDYPIFFSKVATSVIGPEQDINSHPNATSQIDYEAELAVVIGKSGINIPKERAWDHIFGYTIINDVSARDRQRRSSQWFLGKGLDTFCPMGPYLAHRSAVPDAGNLTIEARVNGEVRQHSNTRHLIFDIPTLIATLSEGLTLEPGDVIATGTCAGVGISFDPPRFLRPGDVVEIEVEGLGVLRNRVR